LNSLDLYIWGILEKVLKPTATLFCVNSIWVIVFYAGFIALTYLRLKGDRK
jgi:hypothetical protein